MDGYGAPSQNKVKGMGTFKAPPAGYEMTSSKMVSGPSTTPKPGSGPYTGGIHVAGQGSTAGKTAGSPKAFSTGSGTGGMGKPQMKSNK